MSSNKIHDEHTRLIALKPSLIGLDDIVLSTAEANIFKNGRIYRQPDNLMFDPSTHTLYNVEYKCSHTISQYNHAKDQLWHCRNELKQIFLDWRIVNLYVSDNYRVEKIN